MIGLYVSNSHLIDSLTNCSSLTTCQARRAVGQAALPGPGSHEGEQDVSRVRVRPGHAAQLPGLSQARVQRDGADLADGQARHLRVRACVDGLGRDCWHAIIDPPFQPPPNAPQHPVCHDAGDFEALVPPAVAWGHQPHPRQPSQVEAGYLLDPSAGRGGLFECVWFH